MRRFYWRSLCLCLIPPFVAAYFLVIWLVFLRRNSETLAYGSIKEFWIFYSWFIISVFGIGWSKYGLAGVEVAMIQSGHFMAPDKPTFKTHSGYSWSGPDGWLKSLRDLVRGHPIHAHRLWYLLSLISLLPFIAFPISGLCMELSDGYLFSAAHPTTIGYNSTTFSSRQNLQTVKRGKSRWETGSSDRLPGIGILYTPDYLSRDQVNGLDELPNSFPANGSVPELFVAPQAQVPIAGRVWGLRVGYNCSVVDNVSQFTIVTDKRRMSNQNDEAGGLIYAYNSSSNAELSSNLFAYLEMGISDASNTLEYDGTEPNTFNPRDISKTDILELMIWQVRWLVGYEAQTSEFIFNDTINEPVVGAAQPIIRHSNGTFQPNSSFFDPKFSQLKTEDYVTDVLPRAVSLAAPIGVRCTRFSALGYADLDAKASTFHNFTIGYPSFNHSRQEALVQRFGFVANKILLQQYSNIFDSISLPTRTTYWNSVLYRGFLQARELQQSVMLAHAMDALQFMYDGVTSFEYSNLNPDLTSSRPGKVLTPGIVPAICPAILFVAWAMGCLTLGLRYGFVPRRSNTLDFDSLLSFGRILRAAPVQALEASRQRISSGKEVDKVRGGRGIHNTKQEYNGKSPLPS
ncbi:hypothetical protein P170DRAFT_447573 [Aspergillus steynii IBT 23096]|uniref:Uncharacterized protein n=1 Tax=Aspergillus steynii IBT 23096 TaxID=1392250 RepID=A0A2I2G441_9EURO|nr:uncharacterized protein P170DRAFT_447573 [Aspergillus steynii IBT 23096]PLB47642.1 hypothetical protein P170DRAFT_447573 [Aspergillus steynii IBT 23096]